jgi:hypothetical protein
MYILKYLDYRDDSSYSSCPVKSCRFIVATLYIPSRPKLQHGPFTALDIADLDLLKT